jgi:RNA polymerase sigma-70 factor (ECF subfamily)
LPPASRRERRRCQSLDSPAVIGLAFFFYHRQSPCKKIRAVTTTSDVRDKDDLYQQAASEYGAALARLARGYEADPDKQRDLLQEIHISLWRSLEGFDGLCSLRTWVYRVAHNAATSYVIRQRRARPQMLVSLDEVEALPIESESDRQVALNQLTALIQRLKPTDRQVILAWLDGMDAAEIGDLTGLSPGNVATKVHRIKSILARDFQGVRNGRS